MFSSFPSIWSSHNSDIRAGNQHYNVGSCTGEDQLHLWHTFDDASLCTYSPLFSKSCTQCHIWGNSADVPPCGLPPYTAPLQTYTIGGISLSNSQTYHDDLVWRDPNAHERKLGQDNGVGLWGDPDVVNARPVRRWLVGEGEDEDLETAILRRYSYRDNSFEHANIEDVKTGLFWRMLNLPLPKSAQEITVTGWIESRKDGSTSTVHHASLAGVPYDTSLPSYTVNRYRLQNNLATNRYLHEILSRNESLISTTQFMNFLYAKLYGIKVLEMDLLGLVKQVKDGRISPAQIVRFMSYLQEEESRQGASRLTDLRVANANISGRLNASGCRLHH